MVGCLYGCFGSVCVLWHVFFAEKGQLDFIWIGCGCWTIAAVLGLFSFRDSDRHSKMIKILEAKHFKYN